MQQNTSTLNCWLMQISIAVLYLIFGKVMLHYINNFGLVSILWPSSGLALAALLIGGKRYLWGIFLGALVLNIFTGHSLWVIIGFTMANILEAYLGFWLLTRQATSSFA